MKTKLKILPVACFLLFLFFMLNRDGKAIHYISFQIAAIQFVCLFILLPLMEKLFGWKFLIVSLVASFIIAVSLLLFYGWNIAITLTISIGISLIVVLLRKYNRYNLHYHLKKFFNYINP